MNLVTITKVTKKEYDCNAHRCTSKAKKLFKVYIAFNPYQGTSIVLCPDHLNELGCAVTDALDPLPAADKKIMARVPKPLNAVGWLKAIEDNVGKR